MKKAVKPKDRFINQIPKIIFSLLLIGLYTVLYRVYRSHISAFGCGDECFNYTAGFFLNQGRVLYSQIFFNHQFVPAYISAAIQLLSHPGGVYEILLRHRQFVWLFGFSFSLLFIWRFGWVGLGFALFYEGFKYYLAGDRFIGESLTVYALVYLTLVAYQKLKKQSLGIFDYLLSGLCSWLVIFTRAPYTLSAIFLALVIFWGKNDRNVKNPAYYLMAFFALITFLTLPLKDYFADMFALNAAGVMGNEVKHTGIGGFITGFIYPWYLWFSGEWSALKFAEIGLTAALTIGFVRKILKDKQYVYSLFGIILLGLTNLRPVLPPGKMYFEAFHVINWYGVLVILALLELKDMLQSSVKPAFVMIIVLIMGAGISLTRGDSFYRDKIDTQGMFITNYGEYMQVGEVVRLLAVPGDRFFADGTEDFLYPVTGLNSAYRYGIYAPTEANYAKYTDSRLEMFNYYPPDFYFGTCDRGPAIVYDMPVPILDKYYRLYENGKPSCLYILKPKAKEVSDSKWEKAAKWLYTLPGRESTPAGVIQSH